MGNYVEFACLVRSSLINFLRCPRSPGGCGLGEVGLLVYSNPPLTHSFLSVPDGYFRLLPQHGLVVLQPMSLYLPWVHQHTPMVCSANSPPCALTLDPVKAVTVLNAHICVLDPPRSFGVMLWKWATLFTCLSSLLMIPMT